MNAGMAAQTDNSPKSPKMIAVELPHEDYVRLMAFKADAGKPTKRLVAEWIRDRLDAEERKLASS